MITVTESFSYRNRYLEVTLNAGTGMSLPHFAEWF